MTIQEAIQKAVEGGWHKNDKPNIEENNDGVWVDFWSGGDTRTLHHSDILLDPLFWQSLGKSMGWVGMNWKFQWLNLIHHLAEGGTIESYFTNL